MKTVIPDIMPNFDLEKEGQKQEMRELSKKIFVTNIPFTSDEKKKLMEYLEQKWSQTYFLIYLRISSLLIPFDKCILGGIISSGI